jgi:hypothetical protein
MRGGDHSKDIREYEITSDGLRIGGRLTGYDGLITGVPRSCGTRGLDGGASRGTPEPDH